jgi:hypothetical protein
VQAVNNQLVPDLTLYNENGLQVIASLTDIDSKITNGYRTELLLWEISAVNHSTVAKCVNIQFDTRQYAVAGQQAVEVILRPHGIVKVTKLIQQYDNLVDFDYVGDGFFRLINVEC